MAVEEQELRLTVTLDDKASAQIEALQRSLGGISGGLTGVARPAGQAAAGVRNMNAELTAFARTAGFVGGVVGGVAAELTKMGVEFLKQATDLPAYARGLVELSVHANRASQSVAQFQLNLKDFSRAGISIESATRQLQAFADAVGNVQREQSTVREQLLTGLSGADFSNMQNLIQTVGTKDRQTGLTAIKDYAEQIRAHWARQGQAERGAAAQKQFLAIWGIPDLDRLERDIRRAAAQDKQLMDARTKDAKTYNDAVNKTAEHWGDIKSSLGAVGLLIPGVQEGMKGMEGIMTRIARGIIQLEISMRNPNTPEDVARSEAARRKAVEIVTGAGGVETEREIPAQEGLTPAQIERLQRRFRRGGGSKPQGLMGMGDDAGLGDRFASITTNTDQVKSVTDELKRLNDYFELQAFKGGKLGLLSMPGGGREGIPGGVAPGTSTGPTSNTPGSTNPDTGTTNPPAGPAVPTSGPEGTTIGPYGKPMPPWGTHVTEGPDWGGGTGGGVAGGVPGLPGGPSGRALTKEERAVQAAVGGGDPGDYEPGYSGSMSPSSGVKATTRYDNPGGMYPSPLTRQYGGVDTGAKLIGKHPIAKFPHPEHGSAANMEFARKHGLGKTVGQLRHFHVYGNWNGSMSLPGMDSSHVITKDDLNDREFMTRYTQSTHGAEGRQKPISQKALDTGFKMYQAGGVKQYEATRKTPQSNALGPDALPPPGTVPPGSRTTAGIQPAPNAPGAPVSPGTAGVPPGTGGGISQGIKPFGRNQGKPGSGEIPKTGPLADIMEYAGRTAGVNTEVFAGIEPGHARHLRDRASGGIGSADVTLRDPTTGNTLDSKNPKDRAKMAAYIEAAASAGATGVGHADDYMTSLGIHVGGGAEVAWGTKGRGPAVPPWVREAHARGRAKALNREQLQKKLADLRQQQQPQPGAVTTADTDTSGIAPIHRPNIGRKVDSSATQKVSVKGAGTVDVSVKTEPKGGADKKELVKPIPIPRKRQMVASPSGPNDHDASLDS